MRDDRHPELDRRIAAFVRDLLDGVSLSPDARAEVRTDFVDHLTAAVERHLAEGCSPDNAWHRARASFGRAPDVRRQLDRLARRRRRTVRLATLLRQTGALGSDLRVAWRALGAAPASSGAAVLTLAIALGAAATVFAAADAVILRSLPYRDPDRLVFVGEVRKSEAGFRSASYPDVRDWRASATLADLAAFTTRTVTIGTDVGAERLIAGRVSGTFFSMLGVDAALGRTVQASDETSDAASVVVLGHALWLRRFGGDAGVVGRTIRLSQSPYTVVGVLPSSFHFAPLGDTDLWLPFNATPAEAQSRTRHWLSAVGRLEEDASRATAQADLDRIAAIIRSRHADSHEDTAVRVVPLRDYLSGPAAPIFLALMTAAGLVLLLAAANVTTLLIVRASARRQEFATRMALGASRWHLRRQVLAESAVLTVGGACAGLALARLALPGLLGAVPRPVQAALPALGATSIDARVFFFAVGVALAITVVLGLAVGSRLTAEASLAALRPRRGLGAGLRLRESIIVAEIALAMILVTGAALGARSVATLTSVEFGFDPVNLLTMQITLPNDAAGRARLLFDEIVDRLVSLPGVTASAHVDRSPLEGGNSVEVVAADAAEPASARAVNVRVVSDGYFAAMGVRIVAGRGFSIFDRSDRPRVAVINEPLAHRLFGDGPAIGRRIAFSFMRNRGFEIVGVAASERVEGLDAPPTGVLYAPYSQLLPYQNGPSLTNSLMVRTTGSPLAVAELVRAEIAAVNPAIAVHGIEPMMRAIADSPASFSRRYPALLLTIFAAIAVVLAAVGVQGIFADALGQRRAEIGLRIALGASRASIYQSVMGRSLGLAGVGIAIGLVIAVALAAAARSLLFGVEPTDSASIGTAVASLCIVAALACYFPARRAVAVDPMAALRAE